MANTELIQILDQLCHIISHVWDSDKEELLYFYEMLENWRSQNDDDSEPMTLEEMADDPLLKDIENVQEILWELEHFLISIDELKKVIYAAYI